LQFFRQVEIHNFKPDIRQSEIRDQNP
jgi:hypothetical protein